jgi:predicted enzyme related to lactoylglutathione lyase
MINYRVENLNDLITVLRSEGVTIVGQIQTFDYGKFAWILDPEGNKIELWEPIDSAFKK